MNIGEEVIAKNGLKMSIVGYSAKGRVSIKFEDGYELQNIPYSTFKNGNVYNPNIKSCKSKREERIGQEFISKGGDHCKIIEYRTATDIDIQFDNGTILKHKNYSFVSKGQFKNPVVDSEKERVGEVSRACNGMRIKLIAYRTTDDVDVLFEDGYLLNTKFHFFETGNLRHEKFGILVSKDYYGYTDLKMFKVENGIAFYKCKNPNDVGVVTTIKEILNSVGKDLVF